MSRPRSRKVRDPKPDSIVTAALREIDEGESRPQMDREMAFALTYLHEANLRSGKAYEIVFGKADAQSATAMLRRPRVRRIIEAHMEAHSASLAEVLAFNTAVMRNDVPETHCDVADRLAASRTIAQIYAKIADIQRDKASDDPHEELDLSALTIEEMQTYCDLLSKITGGKADVPEILQALPPPIPSRSREGLGGGGPSSVDRPFTVQPMRQPASEVVIER